MIFCGMEVANEIYLRILYLLNYGIMVLRFFNRDIWEKFEGVKVQIATEVKTRWHPPTTASRSPAPKGGGQKRFQRLMWELTKNETKGGKMGMISVICTIDR